MEERVEEEDKSLKSKLHLERSPPDKPSASTALKD
jgi:hypothetical protein